MDIYVLILPLLIGWILDKLLGDPVGLPHPVVGFGKLISFCEKRWNCGTHRMLKGGVAAIMLILLVYVGSVLVLHYLFVLNRWLGIILSAVLVFYCLAGTTLINEVRQVFLAADHSLEEGRKQVSRIVGRDTSELTDQEVRTAALETLAENLSDGVIAPLFWYLLLGVPGMLAYKMVNTLDSMIGYRNERYLQFGCVAAHIDDMANYIPARLTAFLMVLCAGRPGLLRFVGKYGNRHASPNSGYPESALAGILNCRFGGPHVYFGEIVYKPFIGDKDRFIHTQDMHKAVDINRRAEILKNSGVARIFSGARFANSKKRSNFVLRIAKIAQLVEHQLPKLRVAGSSPVFRSTKPESRQGKTPCVSIVHKVSFFVTPDPSAHTGSGPALQSPGFHTIRERSLHVFRKGRGNSGI